MVIENMDWALSVLERECDSGLYGNINIYVQNGKICGIKIEKTEKPPK